MHLLIGMPPFLQNWDKGDFEAALKDLSALLCDNKRYLKGVSACEARSNE